MIRLKKYIRDKNNPHITIKGSIFKEDIRILNLMIIHIGYGPNEWVSNYVRQNLRVARRSSYIQYYNRGFQFPIRNEWIDPVQFSSLQWLSHVWLFMTPWTAARQASLPITNSLSLLKLLSIMSVMPSNHLILCCPLLLQPSISPSIRVFSNEPALRIRCPKYWSFSFSISSSNEYSRLQGILSSLRIDWLDLLAV